jgi:hypothetical protein
MYHVKRCQIYINVINCRDDCGKMTRASMYQSLVSYDIEHTITLADKRTYRNKIQLKINHNKQSIYTSRIACQREHTAIPNPNTSQASLCPLQLCAVITADLSTSISTTGQLRRQAHPGAWSGSTRPLPDL